MPSARFASLPRSHGAPQGVTPGAPNRPQHRPAGRLAVRRGARQHGGGSSLLARRNLLVAAGVVSLNLGATAAWAASDQLTEEGAGSKLLDRPANTLDRSIDRHRELERRRERRG